MRLDPSDGSSLPSVFYTQLLTRLDGSRPSPTSSRAPLSDPGFSFLFHPLCLSPLTRVRAASSWCNRLLHLHPRFPVSAPAPLPLARVPLPPARFPAVRPREPAGGCGCTSVSSAPTSLRRGGRSRAGPGSGEAPGAWVVGGALSPVSPLLPPPCLLQHPPPSLRPGAFPGPRCRLLPSPLPASAAAAAPGKERRGWGLGEAKEEGETLAGLEPGFERRRDGGRGRWRREEGEWGRAAGPGALRPGRAGEPGRRAEVRARAGEAGLGEGVRERRSGGPGLGKESGSAEAAGLGSVDKPGSGEPQGPRAGRR